MTQPDPSIPSQHDVLNKRLEQARSDARDLAARNDRLAASLREARDKLVSMKARLDALGAPPVTFGVLHAMLPAPADGSGQLADVWVNGRKLRTKVAAEVDVSQLQRGSEVLLNEAMVLLEVLDPTDTGEVQTVKSVLPDGRAIMSGRADMETAVRLAGELDPETVQAGDLLTVDLKLGLAYAKVPKVDMEELVLAEIPDVTWADIGGLDAQIEQITDAIELPFLHRDLYADYQLRAPRGVLLYGPPGVGKTMIAKAVANSLAQQIARDEGLDPKKARSYFFNIKGPELLNKYVGETERHLRLVFERARTMASEGMPVVVFFDEMEAMFRTRGTGVSSDMEATIVPQLLSEIDGVEGVDNVIVIGASNREDLIDPAILRPGRLDVKIKIERPDAQAARDIFDRYLSEGVPLHPDEIARFGGDPAQARAAMIDAVVTEMYAVSPHNQYLEVTYADGDTEILYFKDFTSGAMISSIVARAKKAAIKAQLAGGERGIRVDQLIDGCRQEFLENEDLPNTSNPDDWARISGRKGQRIIHIRTLVTSKRPEGIDEGSTGQYL